MDFLEAHILLRNLIQRLESDEGGFRLAGRITGEEFEALEVALSAVAAEAERPKAVPEAVGSDQDTPPLVGPSLNRRSFKVPILSDVRVCLDFGTAMSKAVLIDDSGSDEQIEVLPLGMEVNQGTDDYLLTSSVYIGEEGNLAFGEAAIELSYRESHDGGRRRLDNIKRRLSEGGWESEVEPTYNPSRTAVTYGDMVLAYLTYFTWVVNRCVAGLGYRDGALSRRFALPALREPLARVAQQRLRDAIGKAQVLADTFGDELRAGIPLDQFISAARSLEEDREEYNFVDRDLSEPSCVAGSMLSWIDDQSSLVLIVDVGAGTSDFGLYRLHVDSNGENSQFLEIDGSLRVLPQAGNFLDRLLTEYVMTKGSVQQGDHNEALQRGWVGLRIREHKEELFTQGSVEIPLAGDAIVHVELDEFTGLDQVKGFVGSLKGEITDILESVDESWLGWVRSSPLRELAIMLTGGGASLPMIQDLVGESLIVGGRELRVRRALSRPRWLDDLSLPADVEYSRVAVALGGARRRTMGERRAKLTAG